TSWRPSRFGRTWSAPVSGSRSTRMRPEEPLRLALLQLRTPATCAEGLAHLEPLVRRAADEEASLVLTPEFSNFMERDRGKLVAQARTMDEDPVVGRVC